MTSKFLKDYGVHHRLSSVAYARSNGRAELGVKTVKRLMMENTSPNGDLNNDSFQRAMLQYRNTPDRDTRLSPAMCVFGRHIRDFIPVLPHKYRPKGMWSNTLTARENALRNRHMKAQERLSEHTKRLPQLRVGDHVRVQNQVGPYPLKWDKTGIVVEVRQYDQYLVKIDGSNRTTLRNRKFLRYFTPMKPDPQPRSFLEDLKYQQITESHPSATSIPTTSEPQGITQAPEENNQDDRPLQLQHHQEQEDPECHTKESTNNLPDLPHIRRSTRDSKPPARLCYSKLGKPEDG